MTCCVETTGSQEIGWHQTLLKNTILNFYTECKPTQFSQLLWAVQIFLYLALITLSSLPHFSIVPFYVVGLLWRRSFQCMKNAANPDRYLRVTKLNVSGI